MDSIPDQPSSSTSTAAESVVVKKYTCMYTADVQKHRKVWHDGFVRIRHVNSKVILLSEDGHTLAESFMKFPSSRIKSRLADGAFSQLPPDFTLEEDEEVDFDHVEDSETRNSAYVARIEELVHVEKEERPLFVPMNAKARQELHKRKMDYLDEHIQRLSKRARPSAVPAPVPATPAGRAQPSPGARAGPTVGSSARRTPAAFETRPFSSPLVRPPIATISKPPLISYRQSLGDKALRGLELSTPKQCQVVTKDVKGIGKPYCSITPRIANQEKVARPDVLTPNQARVASSEVNKPSSIEPIVDNEDLERPDLSPRDHDGVVDAHPTQSHNPCSPTTKSDNNPNKTVTAMARITNEPSRPGPSTTAHATAIARVTKKRTLNIDWEALCKNKRRA